MEKNRLLSLDAFRGFTIAAMILVNNPGSWNYVYSPLLHAEWNGLTPTDLIFPFFIFIVGVSITLSLGRKLENNSGKRSIYIKIITRSAKIFLAGILLNILNNLSFSEIRIAGVLQRIAIVYLISSVLFINFRWKKLAYIASAILLLYWICLTLVPTPGYDVPMVEPGKNFSAWIDSFLLPGKMWQGNWDPEGIFSTLPAISSCIIGILSGYLVNSKMETDRKIVWLFTLGLILSILGYCWSLQFPVNKNLWTSSFVLITSGFAAMIFAASIFIVDSLKRTGIAKFGIVFGANAITIYVLSDILAFVFYRIHFGSGSLNECFLAGFQHIGLSLKLASLVYALLFIGINFIPAILLYQRRVFVKL